MHNDLKNAVAVLSLFLVLSCSVNRNHSVNPVDKYYEGLKKSDFTLLSTQIADSLYLVEGDHVLKFSKESYHSHFQWDSVFQPIYEVRKIDVDGKDPMTTISVSSKRFEFLENNPLVSYQKFYLKSGKIYKIENVGWGDVDWQRWTTKRDSLVRWIKSNHTELDGFINDLSSKGAQDYLAAIELFEKK